jgi:CPA2 family monovalent cation:H+ antiporter-2
VHQAAAAGHTVAFGDSGRLQALMAAGLARASAVVVTYLDEPAAFKVLANIQEHAPQVPVIVRTQDDHSLEKLRAAGATEVVPEAIEGSLMLASHALALVGVPMRRVIRIVQDQRDARYNLLRGFFHGADDNSVDELQHERLSTVTLPPGARVVGRSLASLALDGMDVRVLSLRRSHGKPVTATAVELLQDGDTLVLSGQADALALAEQRLLKG